MSILYYTGLLFKISLVPVIAIISFVIIAFVCLPLWRLRFYKKQGLPTYFFPIAGYNKNHGVSEKTHNDPMHFYKSLSKTNPNATVLASNFGTQPELHLFDTKLIKEFLQNSSYYHKSSLPRLSQVLMGNGLFLAEGAHWKKNRKIIGSVFHFEYLRDIVPLVVKTTRGFLSKLAQEGPQEIKLTDEIQKITGDIVGVSFFGENLSQLIYKEQTLTSYLSNLIIKMADMFQKSAAIPAIMLGINPEKIKKYKEFSDEVKEFRQFCLKIIQDRKLSNTKKNDLLGVLLDTQNASSPEDRFSDEAIIDEFITFFLAGMDTTGHLISMALYLIHEHPEVLEQTSKEINEIYSKEETPSYDQLNKMEVMHSVIKEALRMYNPAPNTVFRTAQEDHKLGDIYVKKGTLVKAITLYNFNHEKFFEEPEKFKPERWYNNKGRELDPYAFIPFSAGPRNCIGQHLATIEAKVIMAEILKTFKLKVPENYKLVMSFAPLYVPKEKIIMRLERK